MTGPDASGTASRRHVIGRLGALEARVRRGVEARRATDPRPDDPFRGLYLTAEDAARILASDGGSSRPGGSSVNLGQEVAAVEADADASAEAGEALRLRDLADTFGLDLADTELLLVALAPDVDPRFERLYGYLQDDVTRRRATVALAMELAGLDPLDPASRDRVSPAGHLVARGLLVLEDADRPFLARSLRVPERVTAFLLGGDAPDVEVEAVVEPTGVDLRSASVPLARGIAAGVRLAYLRAGHGSAPASAAVAAAALNGLAALSVDLGRVASRMNPRATLAAMVLEAGLRSAVIVAGPVEPLLERDRAALADLTDSHWPVVLFGDRAWEPSWARDVPLVLQAPGIAADDRARLWRAAIEERSDVPANGHVDSYLDATRAFHLTPVQIDRAIESGVLSALAEARDVEARDFQTGARRQNAAGLERLARRVEATAGWEDLVVPADLGGQLHELSARARHRDRVLGDWRTGGRSSRGRGITALFAGESGTGKTLAAEVIAHELGLDLYVIDLSTVVDKYIGETEKNLDRIFSEADRVNGVLLFDEADAIFGKRSEVRDARDRYANVEVAYLLQRMERFDGLAVLTTNLRANLDESFTRRLDAIIDFPTPDEPSRQALWRMHLPAELPQADDLDLEFLARRFALAGGNIRNICVTAAYFAAEADAPVQMADLIRATGREYQKLGRLTLEAEFGPYHRLLAS